MHLLTIKDCVECPYCKRHELASTRDDEYKFYSISCVVCGVEGPFAESEAAAITRWNDAFTKKLEDLFSAGVIVEAQIAVIGGGSRFKIDNSETLERWISDPDGVAASLLGFSDAATYREWVERQGNVRCTAKTSKGKQCCGNVVGALGLSPREFEDVFRKGGYCSYHGD